MSSWDIIQIFLILAVMMGMMYGLLFIVKKYFYSFEKKGGADTRIKILSTQVILPKKFVSVIKFNNSVYLLGVSDQSVNLIDKLDANTLISNEEENQNINKPNFLELLKNNMGIK